MATKVSLKLVVEIPNPSTCNTQQQQTHDHQHHCSIRANQQGKVSTDYNNTKLTQLTHLCLMEFPTLIN